MVPVSPQESFLYLSLPQNPGVSGLQGQARVEELRPHAQARLLSPVDKCKVCNEPAAKHVHYGAMTCFSCRAFFRRSIQNNTFGTYVCRRTKSCAINLKSRRNCQFCRYEKCLSVGMKPSWVLSSDEREKRFQKGRDKKARKSSKSFIGEAPTTTAVGDPECPKYVLSTGIAETQNDSPHPKHTLIVETDLQPVEQPPPSPSSSSSSSTKPDLSNQYNTIQMISGSLRLTPVSTHRVPSPPHSGVIVRQYSSSQGQQAPVSSYSDSIMDLTVKQEPVIVTVSQIQPENAGPPILPSLSLRSTSTQHSSFTESTFSPPTISTISVSAQSSVQTPVSSNSPIPTLSPRQPATPLPSTLSNRCRVPVPDYEEDDSSDSYIYTSDEDYELGSGLLLSEPEIKFTSEELAMLEGLVQEHDTQYKSVNFGETLIKEMIMCSMFGIPVSLSAAISGYRLTVERVTRIANNLDCYGSLPKADQNSLLKENADLLVSMRGAIFFDSKKKGVNQVLISMGIDDMETIKTMFTPLMKEDRMKHIDYKTFNSIQQVNNSEIELRYNFLQGKVVKVMDDSIVVTVLTYIILFSIDFCTLTDRRRIEMVQERYIRMLERYIYSKHSRHQACHEFATCLNAVTCIREMADIKKRRTMNMGRNAVLIN